MTAEWYVTRLNVMSCSLPAKMMMLLVPKLPCPLPGLVSLSLIMPAMQMLRIAIGHNAVHFYCLFLVICLSNKWIGCILGL